MYLHLGMKLTEVHRAIEFIKEPICPNGSIFVRICDPKRRMSLKSNSGSLW